MHKSRARTLEQRLLQKLLGLVIFITETAPSLRALINHLCRCLKLKNGFRAGRSGRSRAAMLVECAAKGVKVSASVYQWDARPGTITTCSRAAEAEMTELMRVISSVNGTHFFPRRSQIGRGGVAFVMNDSASFEQRRDGTWPPPPDHILAGACWTMSPKWRTIQWMHFTQRILITLYCLMFANDLSANQLQGEITTRSSQEGRTTILPLNHLRVLTFGI